MLRLGLTGGSGSGKSTVARIFASCGAKIIDTDAVYHSLISAPSPCVLALKEAFGEGILNEVGAIDRKKLASVVFEATEAGKARLALLNDISHRFVHEECEILLSHYEKDGEPLVILDVPLLFESGFDRLCDVTVAVLAPQSLRLQRILSRDGIDEAAAIRRLVAQPSDEFYKLRADHLIYNEGDLPVLQERTLAILRKIGLRFDRIKDKDKVNTYTWS
ncbi:MAG: dephospho-CoA kinase [Clostridia bacterium]|nr:dephospho-CoA kinase [Clostridia bacterium]